MKFKAVIFDLDDTLYNEFDFIQGGYREVAGYLTTRYNQPKETVFSEMLDYYRKNGRGGLFDHIIEKYHIPEKGLINKLLEIYRGHEPSISLYEDAVFVIDKLKSLKIKTGLITDGIKSVQRSKVISLGLDKILNHIIFTDDLKEGGQKPSTMPFKLMCGFLNIDPEDSCYIGDNPFKDFLGPNQIEMISIRVNRGTYKNVACEEDANLKARFTVSSLSEIFQI